ncbi:MAG TPA: methylated-DNA--[protein]-cysteine S-methyltransferase [Methylomirabilota bacterium]|nr:methylated-DNA--[protein]-cysteine S-methyltransferase [Methylomirabilota bacterium]
MTTRGPFQIDEIPCALGTIVILARDGGLSSVDFGDCRDRMLALLGLRYGAVDCVPADDPFGLSSRLRAYLAGDLAAIDDIPVEAGGTSFQRDVWKALRRIPAGTTVTYTDLARAIGRPAAVRAVAAANARNPVAIVVPCHRVVGRDGSLTGYGGGLWRKRWLLSHERGTRAGSASSTPVRSAAR